MSARRPRPDAPASSPRVDHRERSPREDDRARSPRVDHRERNRRVDHRESTKTLATGAGIGAFGAITALLGAAACPVCVVAAPALLGVGLYQRWRERAAPLVPSADPPATDLAAPPPPPDAALVEPPPGVTHDVE